MSKMKVILPMMAVLSTMLTAGALLYRQMDARLERVVFKNSPVTETEQVSFKPLADSTIALEPLNTKAISVDNSLEADTASTPTDTTAVADTTTATVQVETEDRSDIRLSATSIANVVVQIYKPSTTITCPIAVTDSTSAQAVMQQAAAQCDFEYSGREYAGLGFFVDQIDQVSQDKAQGLYWVYSINGVKANLGISAQMVAPGDTITWTYEAGY